MLALEPSRPRIREVGMPKAVLKFYGGVERTVSVGSGQTLLEAAEAAGIPLLHQCRSGSCSTCICEVLEGQLHHRKGVATSLLPMEYAEGKRLSCMALLEQDSVVAFDYPIDLLERDKPQSFKAKVFGVANVASDVVRLTLRAPKRLDFAFSSGQFLRLRVPGTDEWRSYSMASSHLKPHEMDFYLRLVPGGCMSNWVGNGCNVGDLIEAEGPFGTFFLRPSRGKHIFIAGGTGLAPILSMLDALRHSTGPRPPMLLSFGCTRVDQLFALERIDLLGQWLPSLETRLSVIEASESLSPDIRRGNPVEAIVADDIDPGETVVYLCGPPPMIEAGHRHFVSLGVPEHNIYNETFVAS